MADKSTDIVERPTPKSLARDVMLRHLFCFPDDMAAVEANLQRRMDVKDSLCFASSQRLEFEIVEAIKAALRGNGTKDAVSDAEVEAAIEASKDYMREAHPRVAMPPRDDLRRIWRCGLEAASKVAPEQALAALEHAISAAANDDATKPLTPERSRHVERMSAMREAHATITRLRSELEAQKACVKALRPFAKAADNYADCSHEDAGNRYIDNDATLTVADLRDARSTIAALEQAQRERGNG